MTDEPRRVRIICTNSSGEVLLIKWRDPVSGRKFWEPPGGGIERGETPREAAQRELAEETGLTLRISNEFLLVARDYDWAGRHHVHAEAFFLATTTTVEAHLATPTEEERETYLEARFVHLGGLPALAEPVEPKNLASIVGECIEGLAVHDDEAP